MVRVELMEAVREINREIIEISGMFDFPKTGVVMGNERVFGMMRIQELGIGLLILARTVEYDFLFKKQEWAEVFILIDEWETDLGGWREK